MTIDHQRLFDLRALLQAKISSLVWKLVDMRRVGRHETDECRDFVLHAVMGCKESKKRLIALRKSGKNVNPRFTALTRVKEHWKNRLNKVQRRLSALGLI